ncbi:hypothetical protein MMC15_003191 [Xylographa vitiligo]|nr:hypothetical protein [Xylographa vitiligo]
MYSESRQDEPWMTFPFLKLPAEIRNAIYDHSVDFDAALTLVSDNSQPFPDYSDTGVSCDLRPTPGILLLNHQIHNEAMKVLYSKPFIMQRICTPHILLDCFSKLFLQQIRHVIFRMNLDQDSHIPIFNSEDVSYGDWSDALSLLGLVWQQRHSLARLDFPIRGPFQSHEKISQSSSYANHLIGTLAALEGVKTVNVETEYLFPHLNETKRAEIRDVIGRRTPAMECPQSEAEVIPYSSGLMSAISTEKGVLDRFILLRFEKCRRWWSLNQGKVMYKRDESAKESEVIGS